MADEIFYGFFAVVIVFIAWSVFRGRRGSSRAGSGGTSVGADEFARRMADDMARLHPIDPSDPRSPSYKRPSDACGSISRVPPTIDMMCG
ncbi:MAG: hypothetical protein AAF371_09255 [Pseudomonadota bacterium]